LGSVFSFTGNGNACPADDARAAAGGVAGVDGAAAAGAAGCAGAGGITGAARKMGTAGNIVSAKRIEPPLG
jgi:hypothetical protein